MHHPRPPSHVSRITCWKRAWPGWTLKQLENHSTGCPLSSLSWPPVMSHRRRPIRWHLEKWWQLERLVGKQNVPEGSCDGVGWLAEAVWGGNSLWDHFLDTQRGTFLTCSSATSMQREVRFPLRCLMFGERSSVFSLVFGFWVVTVYSQCTEHVIVEFFHV